MSNTNARSVLRQSVRTSTTIMVAAAMLASIGGGMALSQYSRTHQPAQPAVLAYATALTADGLLQQTNQQRSNNHQEPLYINSKLTQAAQAKANDMVARNYWSHNTPDGKQPWDFIKPTGYQFTGAAENLAAGYPDNAAVINGWMNSPGHRENILNANYREVGFGYANSPNYNGQGQQTVVVAMYGEPAGPFTPPAPAPAAKTVTPTNRALKRKPTPQPVQTTPQPQPKSPVAKPQPTPTTPTPQPTPQPVVPRATPKPSPNPSPSKPTKVIVTPDVARTKPVPTASKPKTSPTNPQPKPTNTPTVSTPQSIASKPVAPASQPKPVAKPLNRAQNDARLVHYFWIVVTWWNSLNP